MYPWSEIVSRMASRRNWYPLMCAGTPIWCRISVTVSSSLSCETTCGRIALPAAFSTRLTRTDSSNGLTKKNENPLSRSSCSISSLWNAPVTKNVVWVLLVFWAS